MHLRQPRADTPAGDQPLTKRRLIVREESWDVGGGFSITRSRKWAVQTLMVELHQDGLRGRGEGVPYRRLGETLESVAAQIEGLRDDIENGGLTRQRLQTILGAGAARNALDGVSLAGLLRGGTAPRRDTLFWHYPHHQHYQLGGTMPYAAIRAGDYKLIEFYNDLKDKIGRAHV